MSRRGIALVTVLMATSVLTVLVTSLVVVSRTNLVSGEQYRRREVLLNAAYSGLDYARARLVQQAGWSMSGFNSSVTVNDANLRVVERGSDESSNQVDGTLQGSGAVFHLIVLNRLASTASTPAPGWSKTGVTVPPHCALVQVTSGYEGRTKTLEVLLTRGHLITRAVHAGLDFAANVPAGAPGLTFSSLLPRGNVLTAQRDIYLPDLSAARFSGGNGVVQSGEEVAVNSTVNFDSAGGFTPASVPALPVRLQGNAAALSAASTSLSAKVRMGTSSNPSFSPSKLRQPTEPLRQLAPGTYTFTGPDQVVYRDRAGNAQLYTGSIEDKVYLQDFRFIPHGNVEVPGNLTVDGMVARAGWVPNPPPATGGTVTTLEPTPTSISVGLGYNRDGVPLPSASHQDRLTVNGDLTVHGDLVGNGQIFVKRVGSEGGNLDVAGNSFLSSTRTDGIAVVAEKLAKFREVSSDFATMPAFMYPNDLKHYKTAIPSEYVSAAPSRPALDDFHRASLPERLALVGSVDEFGQPGLRNQPADSSSIAMSDFQALTGIPLNSYPVTLTGSPNPVNSTAQGAITAFVRQVTDSGRTPLTLGQYIRIREFVKSIEFGVPRTDLIDPGDPVFADATLNSFVGAQILNQVQTYDQDAKNEGQSLLDFMNSVDPAVYNGRLSELIFGGLLYSDGNIFTAVGRAFNLYGGMLSRGNIGFDHLMIGRFVYDPSLVEDQFDLEQLGLTPLLFWND